MPMRRKLLLGIIVVLAVIAAGVYLFANRMLGSDLVRTTLEQQLSARFGQPVHIRSVAASLFPRVAVNLRDVTVGESAAVQLGDLRVVTGLRGLFSRTIEDAEIVVSRSRLSLPLPFSLVPAPAPNAPATSGPGFTVTSIRVISFRDIDAVAGNQAVRFNLDASVDGDRLDITRLTMNGKRTRVEAHGALTSIASLQGTVEAKAEPLDLDETIAIASAFTAPAGLTPARGSARPRGQVSRPAQPLPQDPKTRSSETIPMHIIAKIAAPSGQF
jgi:hypothetical protein